jgi:hypothetical protein
LERETGFEPATSTLARSHSTTELFPLDGVLKYHTAGLAIKRPLAAARVIPLDRRAGGPGAPAYEETARSTFAASSGDVGLM